MTREEMVELWMLRWSMKAATIDEAVQGIIRECQKREYKRAEKGEE